MEAIQPTADHATSSIDVIVPTVVGLCAEFDDVTAVTETAARVRDAGFKYWDVHSPFPIHGIDHAMGIRPTILPVLVLMGGLTGCLFGITMTAWINAFEFKMPAPFNWTNLQGYQFFISGKPLWSLPAFIPVIFECTVLFSALTTVFGMLLLNKLPMLYNPLFRLKNFRRATSDRFFIVIDAGDPNFDRQKTAELLRSGGAVSVETVDE
ncbi:MAG: DUF3341 domain-containing protein [Burkholderiales bacterium]|nr:DUF3341 domain-containing protein [Phycisphaerae bacterium]